MKILFICKYNAFRSRTAEAYFNKINKDKNIKATSKGFIIGGNPDSEQVKITKEILGVDISKKRSESVTLQDLIKSDMIFVVASDIPEIMFNYKIVSLKRKLTFWRIKDEQKQSKKNIRKIVRMIKKRVDALNKRFGK